MGIDRPRAGALAAVLAAMLGGACGRTELWPADNATGDGGSDGGTDVPADAGDAAPDGDGGDAARGDAGRSADPCSVAGTPCGGGQRCVPALFRKAVGVPGGPDLVLALGDLNQDGLPDLVTLSPSRYNVAIWLNDRGTGFHSMGSYGVAGQPISGAIGDFTGDGVADIAVAAFSGGEVTTLIGAGDGTFRMGSFSDANMLPRAVVATDLDDDGRLDLVVANQDPNRTDDITLLNGVGGGAFVPAGRYGTFNSAWALAVGDFNGDKKPDIVGSGGGTPLTAAVFYHGAMASPFSQRVASGVRSIAVGDFDGDGIDDIALSGPGAVALLFGTPDNVLRVGPVLSTDAAVNGTASAVVAGDFDGDRHVDLAFADGRQLYIFLGTGTGGFQPARAMLAVGDDTQPSQLAAADLDGDGVTDLLVGSIGGQIVPLLSNASSLLTQVAPVPLTGGPRWSTSGDFDGDGNADIAVSQFNGQSGVLILLGDGRGAFPRTHLYDFGRSPGAVVGADLDGDGRTDLVVDEIQEQAVGARLQRPDGTFGPPNSIALPGTVEAMAVLDANEDGRMDVALARYNDTMALLLGNGDGTFQAPLAVPVVGAFEVVAADLDGDGHVDLATLDALTARVLFGDGHGRFSVQTVGDSANPLSLDTGDTNGDGKRQLIIGDHQPAGIRIVAVGRDRALVAFAATPIDQDSPIVAAGDIDGDGRADVAFGGSATNVTEVALSRGDGHLDLVRAFAGTGVDRNVIVTDVNNDGRADVVTVTTGPQADPPGKLNVWLGGQPFECR